MRVLIGTVLLLALSAAPAFAIQNHIVQPGETLWAIASRHGTSVDAIARANNLGDVDALMPGQRLIIPAGTAARRRAAPAVQYDTYRVRTGDTLWVLARRFDMTVNDLAAVNGIDEESVLQIGQQLKVKAAPAPVVTRRAPAARDPAAVRRAGTLPYRGATWANDLIGLARRFIGTRYRWGATGPSAFDCSGFLQYVYARRGVVLPRTTEAMFRTGRVVPGGELLPGDMVFFTTYRRGPSHAGIYLGEGLFIHSSSGYGSVTITPLSKDYYRKRYLGARRF